MSKHLKFIELPTTTERGRDLTLENGIIKGVSLSIADHDVLSPWLQIEFHCGGCGFGGYVLGKIDGDRLIDKKGRQRDYAAEWVIRCIQIAGAETWEAIPGKPVRTLHEGIGGGIVAIGHFLDDKWFCPRLEWAGD